MKKALLMGLTLVLVAVLAVAGTLAYLTDRDSKVNVFTIGNVEIQLNEKFEQGVAMIPGTDIQKEVTITNTGDNDAWVWYTYAVPKVLCGVNENASLNVIHFNPYVPAWYPHSENSAYWEDGQTEALPKEKTWTYSGEQQAEVTIDGVEYNVYTFLYNGVLPAGETTSVGLKKVYLDAHVDYNKNDGNYYWVQNGDVKLIEYDLSNVMIPVNAYAIQANEFETAEEAYEAYGIQWGENDNGDYPAGTIVTPDSDGNLILAGGTYRVDSCEGPVTVSGTGTLLLYRNNFSGNSENVNALTVKAGSDLKIQVEKSSTLTGAVGGNGIYVESGAVLDLSGEGKLTVIGNNGVDSPKGGSGIGGEGVIYIHDLNNLVAEGYGVAGFGIGGASKNITIENTNIEFVKGGFVQELMVNDPKYGKSEPEGGAAIGSMTDGAVITLNGVTIDKAEGGSKSAGIGARYWTSVTINITDSTIKNVVGGNASAGIGGSRISSEAPNSEDITINIVNSEITTKGGQYGAGIGSGYDTYCHTPDVAPLCTINISGNSVINATGGMYAAGIGTGYHAGMLAGEIESSVTVNAVSGEKLYKDSYTQAMDIGFGVLDPARDGLNNTCTFDNQGTIIAVPEVE